MGSTSDWEVMSAAADMLDELGIEYEKRVVSTWAAWWQPTPRCP